MPWSKFLGCWLFAYIFNIFERQFGLTLSIALKICQLGSQKEGLNHDKKTRKISFIANLFTFSFLRLSLFNRELNLRRKDKKCNMYVNLAQVMTFPRNISQAIFALYIFSYVISCNE